MITVKNVLTFSVVTVLLACGVSYEEPDSGIEAGRQFINAVYNGNFKRANQLIVQDDKNKARLYEDFEKVFRAKNSFGKDSLSKVSIQINKISAPDSLTTLIEFTNAYDNSESALRVIKEDGFWRVKLVKN
jgi:hypothetical protein